eukprot:m.1077808 g.1077808  ORF g.1077808 m.1077808 type:complete len:366 (+) comp24251_c0_seq64:996-2093(+)
MVCSAMQRAWTELPGQSRCWMLSTAPISSSQSAWMERLFGLTDNATFLGRLVSRWLPCSPTTTIGITRFCTLQTGCTGLSSPTALPGPLQTDRPCSSTRSAASGCIRSNRTCRHPLGARGRTGRQRIWTQEPRGALQTVSLFTTGRMPTSSTLPGDAGMRTTRSCIIWMLLRTKVCLSACSPSLPASTAPMEPASTALVNGTRSLSPSAAMAFTGRGRWSTASTLFSCPWTRQSPHPGGGTKRTCSRLAAGSPCNAKGRCDSTWEHAPGPTSLKETHLRELRSCVAMDLHLCRQRLRSVAGLPSFACLSVHCDYPVCACHSALRVVPPAVCNAVVLLGTWETAVDMRMHLVLCAPCCSDVCLGGR